ncbi:hypothetical protein [Streptomyces sp. NPDC002671]
MVERPRRRGRNRELPKAVVEFKVVNERKLADHVMKSSDGIRLDYFLRQSGHVPDTAVEGVVARLAPLGPVPLETFETLDRPL